VWLVDPEQGGEGGERGTPGGRCGRCGRCGGGRWDCRGGWGGGDVGGYAGGGSGVADVADGCGLPSHLGGGSVGGGVVGGGQVEEGGEGGVLDGDKKSWTPAPAPAIWAAQSRASWVAAGRSPAARRARARWTPNGFSTLSGNDGK